MKLIARKTFRTGVQSLWYNESEKQHYVSIKNRTYKSTQPIPDEKVPVWAKLLT